MNLSFCWEKNKCRKVCPVKDLRLICCWKYFQEESRAGLKACAQCDHRSVWTSVTPAPPLPAEESALRRGRLQGKTILAIDDEENILYALEETIRSLGYQCVSAMDGEEGLDIARKIKPALIISDVNMPKLSGFELCNILKNDEEMKDIPIILVTVRSAEKDRLEGGLAGADDYLSKPFGIAQLKEKIAGLLHL